MLEQRAELGGERAEMLHAQLPAVGTKVHFDLGGDHVLAVIMTIALVGEHAAAAARDGGDDANNGGGDDDGEGDDGDGNAAAAASCASPLHARSPPPSDDAAGAPPAAAPPAAATTTTTPTPPTTTLHASAQLRFLTHDTHDEHVDLRLPIAAAAPAATAARGVEGGGDPSSSSSSPSSGSATGGRRPRAASVSQRGVMDMEHTQGIPFTLSAPEPYSIAYDAPPPLHDRYDTAVHAAGARAPYSTAYDAPPSHDRYKTAIHAVGARAVLDRARRSRARCGALDGYCRVADRRGF